MFKILYLITKKHQNSYVYKRKKKDENIIEDKNKIIILCKILDIEKTYI